MNTHKKLKFKRNTFKRNKKIKRGGGDADAKAAEAAAGAQQPAGGLETVTTAPIAEAKVEGAEATVNDTAAQQPAGSPEAVTIAPIAEAKGNAPGDPAAKQPASGIEVKASQKPEGGVKVNTAEANANVAERSPAASTSVKANAPLGPASPIAEAKVTAAKGITSSIGSTFAKAATTIKSDVKGASSGTSASPTPLVSSLPSASNDSKICIDQTKLSDLIKEFDAASTSLKNVSDFYKKLNTIK
jgi:hypothetical protein